MQDRKLRQHEFQKAVSDRYVEQVEWPQREREMQETLRQMQNAREVDDKVRRALEVKEENRR
jgi:ribosomal protein L19E